MTQGIAADKNILVLHSNTNAHGKHDATGAFIPEARAFAKLHGVPERKTIGMKLVKTPKKKRREQTLNAIRAASDIAPLSAIAFFGHGWPQGIQFGFNRPDVPDLVKCLKGVCTNDVKIVLYACLAAEKR